MIGSLPRSITVGGVEYAIRTDFRAVLDIIIAFNDPDLKEGEKVYTCLYILFEDFLEMPQSDYEEAFTSAVSFIDCGSNSTSENKKKSPRLVDWEQDEPIIFPAINKVAGFEVRSAEYLHWWTFMGYYMEIYDGTFSHVMQLRNKKAKGIKLEKWEREFWSSNKDICEIKAKLSAEEQAERDRINALLND